MAVAEFTAPQSNGSDARFRAWGKGLSDALAAVGMVRTADTGQIDWETVTTPTTAEKKGYEVWRFDDDLQAEAPIYFRLDYGSNASSGSGVQGNMPSLWITIGKGSDGAGTITGVLVTETLLGAIGSSGIGYPADLPDAPCYVSTCDSHACIAVVLFAPATGTMTYVAPAFIIERSRDSHGAPTGEGILFARGFGNRPSSASTHGPNQVWVINYDSGIYNMGAPPVNLPSHINGVAASGASSLVQPIAPVFPWLLFTPGGTPWQSLAVVSFMAGDAMPGVATVRLFGRDHQFRVISPLRQHGWGVMVAPNTAASGGAVSAYHVGLAVLWDEEDD